MKNIYSIDKECSKEEKEETTLNHEQLLFVEHFPFNYNYMRTTTFRHNHRVFLLLLLLFLVSFGWSSLLSHNTLFFSMLHINFGPNETTVIDNVRFFFSDRSSSHRPNYRTYTWILIQNWHRNLQCAWKKIECEWSVHGNMHVFLLNGEHRESFWLVFFCALKVLEVQLIFFKF